MNVRLIHAALDVFKTAVGKEDLILRGVIDPSSLDGLNVDTYQREVLGGGSMQGLKLALRESVVPDIEVGMRGERTRCMDGKTEYILLDPVYIIDGFQRVSAARTLLKEDPSVKIRLGATVHFNTNFAWEKNRFKILNQQRVRVSSNVLLRNAQSDYKSIEMIGKLCQDDSFALQNRVQWQQRRLRQEVISAMTLCRVVHVLHGKFDLPAGHRLNYEDIAIDLERALNVIGRNVMRDNVKRFFEIVDSCFGIRKIVFSDRSVQVKEIFLLMLAELFSNFDDFWNENRLAVERSICLKLAKFPIDDPEIVRLSCAGGKAVEVLYQILLKHLNRGKRSRRLMEDDGEKGEDLETAEAGAAAR